MSELSRAISRLKICNVPGNPELRKKLKDAFRAGWEAREILANKRVSEIEKAATLAERERAAKEVDGWVGCEQIAKAIRRGQQ